jgi:GxxExxY protein
MNELILKEECYRVMGACFKVYKEKDCDLLEAVYQEGLELEFGFQAIPSVAQMPWALSYKGVPLQQTYKADFVCFGTVLVEIKAVSALADELRAQVVNYLHATGLRVGLLVNFGHYPKVEWERIVA